MTPRGEFRLKLKPNFFLLISCQKVRVRISRRVNPDEGDSFVVGVAERTFFLPPGWFVFPRKKGFLFFSLAVASSQVWDAFFTTKFGVVHKRSSWILQHATKYFFDKC